MYYDKIAKGYDELHRQEQEEKIALIKQHLNFSKEEIVLDLGCGPFYGDWPCIAYGADPSIELLKQSGLSVVCAKAEKLPFRDNVFDKVISITAFQNFDDFDLASREILRVGKDEFVITYLRKSPKADEIEKTIAEYFSIVGRLVQKKDIIFFLRKNI